LRTFWSSEEKFHAWPVETENGTYRNPIVQAFATHKPLWIVGANKEEIRLAERCQDLWSSTPDVPHYTAASAAPIRTLVVVPLFGRHHRFGVYFIETSKYIELTDVARLELQRLGEALGILYSLFEVHNAQVWGTEKAVSDLKDQLDRAKFPRLAKPHFFVAYSHRANEEVRLLINGVLEEFADKLEVTDWHQMSESGNINRQIAKEITDSRFGLCYLSQPVAEGSQNGHQYEDNVNVVFEAGMLHARTSVNADDESGEPTGWIPVREEDSPTPPFDFASERILIVPRVNGKLNASGFQTRLRERVVRLLGES
jgi:hypothetical protein